LKQIGFGFILAGLIGPAARLLLAAEGSAPAPATAPSPPAASVVQTAPSIGTQVPNCPFAGKWSYDSSRSDDPASLRDAEASSDARSPDRSGEGEGESRHGGSGGYGGYGGYGGGGGGRHMHGMGGGSHEHSGQSGQAGGPGHGRSESVTAALHLLKEPPPVLVVSQDGDQIEIVELGGRLARFKADGEPHPDQSLSATAESRARWSGSTFRVESDLGSGGTLTQTYELEPETGGERPLRVVTAVRLPHGDQVLTLRRSYVHAP
jgi:hypothetical protein